MNRNSWALLAVSVVACLLLRWFLEAVGVPRNLAAAAAGLGVLIVMIAVVLAFVHRRREGSSDHAARQQRAEPGTE